ncbi:hypothetical protein CCAX7_008590 [Capsulimonas corticalis]|uniref:Uncharacterized protein n=1 Tax=Capsulimonas corticalis TaxID=2219043 RepID=A0A402CU19_9BACT|nr:hypothetical protein [Capsulimonas corticalis]BDI28808.1 hypothetical protein CCAX7_008590 [Capsulimonas corticalis]
MLLRRWKLLMPLGAISFFGAGINGLYVGLANPHPKTMTANQFAHIAPNSGWYHVTGGYLDLSQSIALTDDGRRPGYGDHPAYDYIALHQPNEAPNTPVSVFVRTADPALMQAAQDASGGSDSSGEQTVYARTPVYRRMDITGMVQTGMTRDSSITRRLENTGPSVDDNLVVIADGAKPNLWRALGSLLLGLILGYGCVQMWIGDDNPFRRNAKQDDLPTQPGLGSIPYSPQMANTPVGFPPPYPPYGQAQPPQHPQPYGQAQPQYAPTYGQPATPQQPAASYGQAPRPAAPQPAAEPAKPNKTDSIPPVFDPFADQQP